MTIQNVLDWLQEAEDNNCWQVTTHSVKRHLEEVQKQQLILYGVSNSVLLEELRLKLIGMECFADEYYNEDAKAGCKTIFDELKDWIDKKRV